MTHTRETSPKLRLRDGAARLALLVACVSVIATSEGMSQDVVSEPYSGPPVSLTTEAPEARVPVVVRVTATKPPDGLAEAEMTVLVTARWTPADPSQTVRPSFRAVVLESESESSSVPATAELVPGEPVTVEARMFFARACTLASLCEWTSDLSFELQPEGAAGTVEVTWTASAQAHMSDTSKLPEGFKVIVSEP